MSPNLIEFLKVFLVVFTFSGLILSVRRLMSGVDTEEDIKAKNTNIEKESVSSSDTMDYDGMGNYGRFPKL